MSLRYRPKVRRPDPDRALKHLAWDVYRAAARKEALNPRPRRSIPGPLIASHVCLRDPVGTLSAGLWHRMWGGDAR